MEVEQKEKVILLICPQIKAGFGILKLKPTLAELVDEVKRQFSIDIQALGLYYEPVSDLCHIRVNSDEDYRKIINLTDLSIFPFKAVAPNIQPFVNPERPLVQDLPRKLGNSNSEGEEDDNEEEEEKGRGEGPGRPRRRDRSGSRFTHFLCATFNTPECMQKMRLVQVQ